MFGRRYSYSHIRFSDDDVEYKKLLKKNPFLSKNFRLNEFLVSQTASRHGIENIPSKEEFLALVDLCRYVLQPIRDFYKRPLVISSGYRSKELNTKIKGAKNSQHMKGCAVDFEILGLDNYYVAQHIANSGLVFDQLILEFHYKDSPQSGWVHVSYDADKDRQRREVLTINKKGTKHGITYGQR